jgi:hypothetical protein
LPISDAAVPHRIDRRPSRWPFFWAPLLSILIGAVAYFVVGEFVPGWNCSFERDNGRGAILLKIPAGVTESAVRVELDPPAGFPPRRRCRAYVGEENGGHRVVAEADYPSEGLVIAAIIVTALPLFGVALWGVAEHRRRQP